MLLESPTTTFLVPPYIHLATLHVYKYTCNGSRCSAEHESSLLIIISWTKYCHVFGSKIAHMTEHLTNEHAVAQHQSNTFPMCRFK